MRAEQIELAALPRPKTGKTASHHTRANGMIPVVLYGRGVEPMPLAVNTAEFTHAMPPAAWYHTLVNLKLQEGDDATAMIVEVQRDLLSRKIASIDFKRVSLSETVRTHIAIHHVGESPGVKKGGIVDQVMHEVMVECTAADMPDHLEVDISGLDLHDSVRVRDIRLPEGVRVLAPEDEAVIVLAPPVRAEAVEPTVAAEGVLVEEQVEPERIGAPE